MWIMLNACVHLITHISPWSFHYVMVVIKQQLFGVYWIIQEKLEIHIIMILICVIVTGTNIVNACFQFHL